MSPPRVALRSFAASLLTLCALGAVLLSTAAPATAASGAGDTEAVIAQRFADERARAGLPAVSRSSDLDAVAREWSRRQAADGEMKHNPNLRGQVQPARAWYENVGKLRGVPSSLSYGEAGARLHQMWMDSSGHRANILRTPLTDVGIGVAAVGDEVYATVVFRERSGGSSAPEPQPSPDPEPKARASSVSPKDAPAADPQPQQPEPQPEPAPAPQAEPAPEPAPAPEPEPTEELDDPGEVAEELDRRTGADAVPTAASERPVLPGDAVPDRYAEAGPPVDLYALADAAVGLPSRDEGPPLVPLLLGLGTITGAVVVGAAGSRRGGR